MTLGISRRNRRSHDYRHRFVSPHIIMICPEAYFRQHHTWMYLDCIDFPIILFSMYHCLLSIFSGSFPLRRYHRISTRTHTLSLSNEELCTYRPTLSPLVQLLVQKAIKHLCSEKTTTTTTRTSIIVIIDFFRYF